MSHPSWQTPEKFWAMVDRSGGPDACWPWTGRRDRRGYGRKWWTINGRSKEWRAHQIGYFLTHGDLPPRVGILHDCDDPPCCNPRCLHPGDQKVNMAEAKARGRTTKGRATVFGSAHGNAKLTEEAAVEISRRLDLGATKIGLSREFNISRWTVQEIAKGKRWRRAIEAAA